jgi:hypothetical protein
VLAYYPPYGINNIAFAASVGAYNARNWVIQQNVRFVGKRFKPFYFERF